MSKVEARENLQDISGPEKENKEPGLELAKGKELDNVVDAANSLAKKMERNEDITDGDVSKLDEALREVKVNFYGDEMTIEEIRMIPDLKKNKKIWEDIRKTAWTVSDIPGMTFVTSRVLFEYLGLKKQLYRGSEKWAFVNLNGLKEISAKLAQTIIDASIQYPFHLNGLKSISDEALEILLRYDGVIELRGLEDLSDKAIEMLAESRKRFVYSGSVKTRITDYNIREENKK